MTVPRMLAVLIALTLVAVAVVAMRVEYTQHAREIQKLQFRRSELEQRLGTQDIELARLRAPREIRDRAERLGIEGDAGGRPAQATP